MACVLLNQAISCEAIMKIPDDNKRLSGDLQGRVTVQKQGHDEWRRGRAKEHTTVPKVRSARAAHASPHSEPSVGEEQEGGSGNMGPNCRNGQKASVANGKERRWKPVCAHANSARIYCGHRSTGLSSQQHTLAILTGLQAPRLCSKSQSEF